MSDKLKCGDHLDSFPCQTCHARGPAGCTGCMCSTHQRLRKEASEADDIDAIPFKHHLKTRPASLHTPGEVERLREALTEAVHILERLPYGDWPGANYSGKSVAANALIRRARKALQSTPPAADAVERARCSVCGCGDFVRIDVRADDEKFVPSTVRRCVGCKTTFTEQEFAAIRLPSPTMAGDYVMVPTTAMIDAGRKAITDRYYAGGKVHQMTAVKPRELAEIVLRAALGEAKSHQ